MTDRLPSVPGIDEFVWSDQCDRSDEMGHRASARPKKVAGTLRVPSAVLLVTVTAHGVCLLL